MLVELRIKDFAIIDRVDIAFSRGLNILTGETGAGKSIIIQAVNMLLGDRSPEGLIRTGAHEGTVEALFDASGEPRLAKKFEEMGIGDPREILVKRTIARSGRGRVFVNGEMATLSILSRVGEAFLSVYGQHEHQTLQKPEMHTDILDEYGKLIPLRTRYEESFREMERLKRQLSTLREKEAQRLQDRELMTFQSQEIAAAHLQAGEEDELRKEKEILANAEKLVESADLAERAIYSDESSACERLGEALQKIKDIVRIDSSMAPIGSTVESSLYQLEESAYSLRNYRSRMEFDPERLEDVNRRLDEIQKLKRKYGGDTPAILNFKEAVDRRLDGLASDERLITELEKRIDEEAKRAAELARTLSLERGKVAAVFRQAVERELSSLGMEKTLFEVRFQEHGPAGRDKDIIVDGNLLDSKGMETLEFYISPNVGEEPKPLGRIASGGELSRIMLAIKQIIASTEPGQTFIFDEVDAGIGGAVSEVVGKKLKDLSQYHQVLCVTHLPQIASFADVHHSVTKTSRQNRTITEVRKLNPAERVEEIARMLGGIEITEKTRAHAREMIETAKKWTREAASHG